MYGGILLAGAEICGFYASPSKSTLPVCRKRGAK
jgi:hypothetical protein